MCSMASLLFLRFGLLSLFDPGPPTKKKRKKKHEKPFKLAKLLRKLAPKGRAWKGGGKEGKMNKMPEAMKMEEEMGEKAEETWTKEEEKPGMGILEAEKNEGANGGKGEGGGGGGGALVEWTVGGFEEENEEEEMEEKKEMEAEMGGGEIVFRKRSISTSNLHCKEANEGNEKLTESSRAQSADLQQQQKIIEQKGEEEEGGQKKRKKSFKICQCIPRANTFEEINLARKNKFASNFVANSEMLRPQKMTTNSAGSRFKITPVENRYKRGRWQCWDYYEGADAKKGTVPAKQIKDDDLHPLPPYSSPSSSEKEQHPHQFGRSSLSPPGQCQTPPGSHQQPPQLPRRNSFQLITIKNLEDRRFSSSVPTSISEENMNLMGEQKQEQSAPPPSNVPPRIVEPAAEIGSNAAHRPIIGDERRRENQQPICPPLSVGPSFLSPIAAAHAAPNPPSQLQMIQQFGLEQSLSLGLEPPPQNGFISAKSHHSPPQPQFSASFGPGQIQFNQQKLQQIEQRKAATLARRNSSASTTGPHHLSAGVAIDSKIEQAMDLVKTHLIYAVRDEIELLRSRIVELETTVIQLEAENTILRENIPNEVLATLCLDPVPANPQPSIAFAPSNAAAIAQ